jgi:geranylgeranyl diphosphate synthase type II
VCRALGGRLESALPTAAALELFHNAFLVHDDVEDGSEQRRDGPTLHTTLGRSAAINVGDAMLALTLRPLLENTRLVGLGPALRILHEVSEMSVRTAEGQATELTWIREHPTGLSEQDYLNLVYRKTTVYSFVVPMRVGAIAARVPPEARVLDELEAVAIPLGAAFQIQDDLLNLEGAADAVGKEPLGDLWEGKRTLMLLHALRHASPAEAARAREILRKPRPEPGTASQLAVALRAAADALDAAGQAEAASVARASLRAHLDEKRAEDVAWLHALLLRTGAMEAGHRAASAQARRAADAFHALAPRLRAGVHAQFLEGVVDFVVQRGR